MKTENIEAFVEVVRSGSLTAAAERLGISQSLLTRHIQSFEDELQVALFDRRTKPMQPTTLGLRVSEASRQVLDAVARLREVAAADAPVQGSFRLGATQGIGELLLPALIDELAAAWAEVRLEVSTGWSDELLGRVQRSELRAAAVFMPADGRLPKGLKGTVLARTRLVVVSQRSAQQPPLRSLAQCNRIGWILNPDGCGFRAGLRRQLSEQGLALNATLDTHSTEVQLEAVSKGHGIGLMPLVLLERSPHRASLRIQTVKDFAPSLSVWLVSREEPSAFEPVVERVGKFLKRALSSR